MGGHSSKRRRIITLFFTKSELTELQEAFDTGDGNKDGFISVKELHEIMSQLNHHTSREDLEAMIAEAGIEDDTIDFGGLLFLLRKLQIRQNQEEQIQHMFELMDVHRTGKISPADLRAVMDTIEEEVTDLDIQEMMAEADTNHDGYITFDEFRELCLKLALTS